MSEQTRLKFKKAGINYPDDLFTNDDILLCNLLELNLCEINNIRKLASLEFNFSFSSARNILSEDDKSLYFTTGCEKLDKVLQGGMPRKGITEIVGESSTGKTQLCLQLSITSQLSNNGEFPGVLYISTECQFPNRRLHEIISRMSQRVHNQDNTQSTSQIQLIDSTHFSDEIFLQQIDSVEALLHCLRTKVALLVSRRRANLIIVDSVAALFRSDYDVSTASVAKRRAEHFAAVANELFTINRRHNVAVVCVNQVKDSFDSNCGIHNSKYKIHPSLGLVWSNLISTRIFLSKTNECITVNGNQLPVKKLEVIFSSYIPNNACKYIIDTDGVKAFD